MRYFTMAEAEALIPKLEEIFGHALRIHVQACAKSRGISERQYGSPESVCELEIEKAQLQFLMGAVNEWLEKIAELGAIPKGLEPALVDFPCKLEGREVYLCWQLGEKKITHYHDLEEGFSGRKALPHSTYSA